MPVNILNLSAFRVTAVEEEAHDYHVRAEIVDPPSKCRECGSDRISPWGAREAVIKDLPIHGKRVGIYVQVRRFRCAGCGKTFSETMPAVAENRLMTDRLVRWIGEQSMRRTFTSIAEETGVVEGTVRNIFRDFVTELEKTVRFETPKWMGIDEIHLIKPRCVVSNIANNTIVELLANRNKETVARYLARLPEKDRVQHVAMDMWTPYRDAVKTVMPWATIVIDKFHVVRMANDALERARKSMRGELTIRQKRGLMHDRFVLLRRETDLTPEQRFTMDGWVKNYPLLGEAYRLKEAFYGVYEQATSRQDAEARWVAWHRSVPQELMPHFGDLVRAVMNWEPHVFAYFDHPVTNAYTESLNNLIRVMNRLGRGYSFEALRAKILFTEGMHKRDRARPKFERRTPERERPTYGRFSTAALRQRDDSLRVAEPRPVYGVDIATLIAKLEAGEL